MVVQLAKREGLKVIACAGSDEKIQFMKDIGADVAFNYKTTSVAEVLQKEGPINMYVYCPWISITMRSDISDCSYWDNVGNEQLDAALLHAAKGARFIVRKFSYFLCHEKFSPYNRTARNVA